MIFKNLSLPFLLVLTIVVLFIGITKPFIGFHDWNGVVYSQIARNYLRYGFLETKFGQVLNPGQVDSRDFLYKAHYPPLFPITLSFYFRVFGIHEASARLLPITLSVLMVFYFYKLVVLFWDKEIAFFASLFLIFTPMLIYFAKMPAHEILNTSTAVICIYYYFLWFRKESKKLFLLMFFLTLLREIIDWSGYFLPPLFLVHTFFFKRKAFRKLLVLLPLSLLMFFLHLLYVKMVTGSFFGEGLFGILLVRLGFTTEKVKMFQPTILHFLKKELTVIPLYFTRVVAILAFIYLLVFAKRIFKKEKLDFKFKDGLVLMLLIFGFAYGVIFRNALWFHDYLLFYALPFFALSATLAVNHLVGNRRLEKIVWLIVFLLFVTEKTEFTKALLKSDYEGGNYRLCQAIDKMTEKESRVLMTFEIGNSGFFFNFYLDRPYNEVSAEIPDFKKKEEKYQKDFDYLIAGEKDPQEFLDYLTKKYPFKRYQDYYVFSL